MCYRAGKCGATVSEVSETKDRDKVSIEAELVEVSDTASLAIHLRNYVVAQGYKIGPALIYQGNMSCKYGSDEASQNLVCEVEAGGISILGASG